MLVSLGSWMGEGGLGRGGSDRKGDKLFFEQGNVRVVTCRGRGSEAVCRASVGLGLG